MSRPQPPTNSAKHTDNNLDFIRLLAALAVLISHSYPLYANPAEPLALLTGSITLGTFAVYIFFIVSGFLVAQSWNRDPDPVRFSIRRALRLLPGLYVFLFISTVFVGPLLTELPLSEYFSAARVSGYVWQLGIFWLQGYLPGVYEHNVFPIYFNGSLWSIRIEVACYIVALVLGIVGVLSSKAATTAFALVAFVAYYYATYFVSGTHGFLNMEMKQSLDVAAYFYAGSMLFHWWPKLPKLHGAYALATLIAILTLGGSRLQPVLHLALPFLILSIAFHPVKILSFAASRGDFSYGIYVYSFPVQQTVMHFFGHEISFAAFITLSLIGTMACAFLSWHVVERPALQLKPTRRNSRRPADDRILYPLYAKNEHLTLPQFKSPGGEAP